MANVLNIELTPYEALSILKFLSEWEKDFETQPKLASFNKTYKNYSKQVLDKITMEQFNEAVIETQTNQALGYDPPSKS